MKTELCKIVKKTLVLGLIWLVLPLVSFSQNDVMMQAFYWNVPVDQVSKNGTWWDVLRTQCPELKSAGFNALWVPPPSKGNWGISDAGYGVYDHYDLGAYNQKGSVETRYGSKAELLNFLSVAHASPRLDVFADAVLNHTYGFLGDSNGINDEEANPAVKAYVRGEAHNGVNVAYQNTDIKWVIPNATSGDYYIQIKGYNLPWSSAVGERGYNLNVNWTNATETDPGNWESEPNNGNGQTNNYPGSGITIRGHAEYQGDIDEYKVHLNSTANIIIKLTAMKEIASPWQWVWADQTLGYYPVSVWYNGQNLATTTLEARTATKSNFPTHTGTGEANFQWSYLDYHPVDASDWLGGDDGTDNIIPNQRWFGNDFNTYDLTNRVLPRLQAWGNWMVNTVGFDGFRLDFVRGFQIDFVARWINGLPKIGGQQRYIVGEYWTERSDRLKQWIDGNASHSPGAATVSVFDFPLRGNLQRMCNGNGASYNMSWLNHAGMVRDPSNAVSGVNVCTFVDNHDNAKNSKQWVAKDWKMAYAYTLTHEGRPCVLYNHFYGVAEQDWENGHPENSVTPPSSLKDDIRKLIFIRQTYLGGTLTVLSEVGNPYPSGDVANVYVARRGGNSTKSGAIVVINNNDTQTKGLWVSTNPTGWSSWANLWLKNALDPTQRTQIQADGRVYVQAPARGYAIYVLENEYVAYTLKSAESSEVPNQNENFTVSTFPMPASEIANINIRLTRESSVDVSIYNTNGQMVAHIYSGQLPKGSETWQWATGNLQSGLYLCKFSVNGNIRVLKILVT
jgi:alpha-amylase